MSEWHTSTLLDIVELIGGGTPKTSVDSYWNGDIPWLSVKDFNNNKRYVYSTEKHISQEGLENSSAKLLQKDDIIISARGTVGELAMISSPMAFNQSCYGVRGKRGIDQTFLYYLIKNSIRQLKAMTHGSVFDTITRDTFSNILVSLPDIKTQRAIALLLSNLDDKIEENELINQNLEQQARTIFESWCIPENASNEVPSSWKSVLLGEIADISSGKRPPDRSATKTEITPYPLIGATSVMGFTSDYNYSKKILVTGRVGTHGVVQRFDKPCWASDNTLVITSPFYEFVYQCLQRVDYTSLNRGSTQPLITQSDLKKTPLVLPDEKTLASFENIAEILMQKVQGNEAENEMLASLRDVLLPKLMSGELDVSNIDI